MTEALYYQDAYKFSFQAKVISCRKLDDNFAVILDKTCFYPEGGGQSSDRGRIENAAVLQVQKQNGDIVHYTSEAVEIGNVEAEIDAGYRLQNMQQHTGQHILSQAFIRAANLMTKSVHLGEEYTALELESSHISSSQLAEAEEWANQIIRQNLPVKLHWVSAEQSHRFNIRKAPPDVQKIRIVEIDGLDFSACGGTHVSSTGEVGLIKIFACEKIRGNIRVKAKIGKLAYSDYANKTEIVQQLSQILTCGEDDLVNNIRNLQDQFKAAKKNLLKLQEQNISSLAEDAKKTASTHGKIKFVRKIFSDTHPKLLRTFAELMLAEPGYLVSVFNQTDDRVNWLVGHSLESDLNLQNILPPLFPLIEGNGGGNPNRMQGAAKNPGRIELFVKKLEEKVIEEQIHE